MIKTLFGNQNIERVLFFLFVNERCYGTQLQSLLEIPLTPIQKALIRLEKNGVLKSHYEGKSRIYQFNPSFPLRWELEALLKKAYTLLPPSEKKQYCFIHKKKIRASEEWQRDRSRKKELSSLWERLLKVEHLSLTAKSRQGEEKLVKTGKAKISTSLIDSSILTFRESGHWFADQHPDTSFTNTFRWTLDKRAGLITLEHLRHGAKRPVFLFHLTPVQPSKFESVDAHLFGEDTYLGNITCYPDELVFHWRIIGPEKNDELIYHYR